MSWLKAFVAVVFAGLAAGCGFVPIAAPAGGVPADQQLVVRDINVSSPNDRYEYELRRGLSGFVTVDPAAPYTLNLTTKVERTNLAITSDDEITRFNLEAVTSYQLVAATGDQAYAGETRAISAVNATTDTFATQTSERAAMTKLADATAEKIVTALRVIALRQATGR